MKLQSSSKPYVCEYCNSGYVRESTLMAHLCEKKRRALQKDERRVRLGFYAFNQFYKLSAGAKKDKTYEEFCKSSYYNAFVKFGSFVSNVKPLYPEKYINHVVTSGVKLDHWCREEMYETYAIELIKKEGVEEQSELILAAKDMMDKVTSFLEDLASMKTEGMLELADRIRDEMGADKSDAFLQKIQPAIEQAEATLTTTRQELDNGVRILTGEEVASDPMGADDTMDMDTELDSLDSEGGEETDEFGASDAEAGGTEPEGREQRESKEVFESSSRLYSKLAGK